MIQPCMCAPSHLRRVQLFMTPWTVAHQAPLSLGFSRQEYWSGLPFPSLMHKSEVTVKSLSRVRLLATPWTAAHQAPPSIGFSRQEYWSGVPLPSPRWCLVEENNNHPIPMSCDIEYLIMRQFPTELKNYNTVNN